MGRHLAAMTLLVCMSAAVVGQPNATAPVASQRSNSAGDASPGQAALALKHDEPIYVVAHTAVDCPICKVWRESTSGLPAARRWSDTWPYVRLVLLERHSLYGSEDESLYPPSLRDLYQDRRERYQLSPPTPLFEIVVRNRVVLRMAGLQGWTEHVVPALGELERTRETFSSSDGLPR